MKTSRPFSTISYNSKEFLLVKLGELVRNRTLSFWSFIRHLPEEDEKKEHLHLRLVPNKQVDTDSIKEYLLEYDPTHPDKPLGCTLMKPSKFDDWYLYAIHDPDYLASKGQTRKYHYLPEEVISSDEDTLREEVHQIDRSKLSKIRVVREAVEHGVPFRDLVMTGQVPVQQVYAFEHAYDVMKGYDSDSLNRNGRATHTPKDEPKIDFRTGEVMETGKVSEDEQNSSKISNFDFDGNFEQARVNVQVQSNTHLNGK